MSRSELAVQAQTGFASAAEYDAHRPSYPSEAVQKLLEGLEIANVNGARVADLAAGTGKFTELLANRPEDYEIVAIEPHDDLRRELEKKNLRGVRVIKGFAENMSEIEDESLEALVAAQSWHWFANKDALKEIHRVLKPTGVFGMIWNVEDYNAPKSWNLHSSWESKMRDAVWSVDDSLPRYRHETWRQVFEDQNATNPISMLYTDPLFTLPLGEDTMPFKIWLSKEDVWARFRTQSVIANLGDDKFEKMRAAFFTAVESDDTETDAEGRIAVHGQTIYAWTTRIPGEPLRSGG